MRPSVHDFSRAQREGRKISMLTCYDAWSARLLAESEVDCILVGDSVAMVVHGYDTTVSATVEMMAIHVAAVARGLAAAKFIVGDLPFLSFRRGVAAALDATGELMRAGAHAVKLEGVEGHEDVVKAIVGSGVPVMGHLGLTPQSIHQLGGWRVQGRDTPEAERLLADARLLEELGCFSLVLECVPSGLAKTVTEELSIPTIGIGAGPDCDGQVLVLQDMLGASLGFEPKFLRRFREGGNELREAVSDFVKAVEDGSFPSDAESYE